VENVPAGSLPVDWIERAQTTREIGSEWLRSRRSPLLRVPGALVPEMFNVLLNPAHSAVAHVRIEAVYEYPFDPRIKR